MHCTCTRGQMLNHMLSAHRMAFKERIPGDTNFVRNIHFQGDPQDRDGNEWRTPPALVLKQTAIANYIRWAFAKVEMMESHLREEQVAR